MELEISKIVQLVDCGVLNTTEHDVPVADAYKASKFRRGIKNALDEVIERERALATIDWNCKDLNAAGKVNVGAPSSTTATVNVAGTVWASTGFWSNGYVSAGGVSSSSDARLKDNIKDFKYSAELLMSLKPREWDWNGKTAMEGHAAGFVAQEIEPLLPYAVTERTYKQMVYDTFHAVAISGLQDHETRIQELERENRELKDEIKRLKTI